MSTPTLKDLIEKATPGPWEANYEIALDYRPYQVFNAAIGSRVAVMSGGGPLRAVCGPEEKANAQLIARCNPATMAKVVEALEGTIVQFGPMQTLGGLHPNDPRCRVLLSVQTALNLLNGKPTQ